MYENIAQEVEMLEALTIELRGALAKAPKGQLRASISHGRRQFYCRLTGSSKGKYLSLSKDQKKISRLAQKEYDEKLLKRVLSERERYQKALKAAPAELVAGSTLNAEKMLAGEARLLTGCGSRLLQRDTLFLPRQITSFYETMPPYIQELVNPRVLSDAAYADQWASDLMEASDPVFFSREGCIYKSNDGTMMRSKSEVLIAGKLRDAGLPYVYEQPLLLDENVVHPDFLILNPATRQEFVWEHLGMMDDPSYASNAVSKLRRYAACGLVPGNGLIVTQETSSCPLDLAIVDLQIALLSTSF